MANMPGQNEQPKPASGGGEKQPEGHHSPGTQQPQNWAQGPGGQQTEYKPIEPKRHADEASGLAGTEREPEAVLDHTPGYEAQQQKKEGKEPGRTWTRTGRKATTRTSRTATPG